MNNWIFLDRSLNFLGETLILLGEILVKSVIFPGQCDMLGDPTGHLRAVKSGSKSGGNHRFSSSTMGFSWDFMGFSWFSCDFLGFKWNSMGLHQQKLGFASDVDGRYSELVTSYWNGVYEPTCSWGGQIAGGLIGNFPQKWWVNSGCGPFEAKKRDSD